MKYLTLAASIAVIALLPLAGAVSMAAPDTDNGVTMGLFTEVYDEVRSNYVEPVSEKHLIEGAIKGMLASLDPHSSYMDAKEYRDLMVQTQGQFGGLGMQVTMEGGAVKVVSPLDDTPAAAAGMKPGDLILAIDGAPVSAMSLTEAVAKLRGAIGTGVKLTVRRQGRDPFEITLTRAVIHVDPVKSRLIDGTVGYVRITSFSERADPRLEAALAALKTQSGNKLAGVVLDLRNNPGGLLDQAVAVANDFLDQGGIVSIKGRLPEDNRVFDARPDHDLIRGLPLVVLINGGSASASEIVAGALHDDHRAVLLGTRSFGKGSVQTVLPLSQSGGGIRLTTALYYTPSGRSIQAEGIQPDVVVEPAKIEKIASRQIEREADLKGALANTGPEAAAGAVSGPVPGTGPAAGADVGKAPPNVPPGTTPLRPAADLDVTTIGSDTDYQLVRAVDLLRAAALFKNLGTDKPGGK